MLDYRLDVETEALRKTVQEFAHEVVAPQIGEFYERDEFPTEIVRQMGQLGLFGLPAVGLGLAVLWAWLESTQIQESNSSGTRLSEAGNSLADSFSVMPQLCGLFGALYLAYALVRDNHAG